MSITKPSFGRIFGIFVVVAGLALAGFPGVMMPDDQSLSAAEIERAEIAELAVLASMGVEPSELTLDDATTVQERNALIPISANPLESPAGIFRLSADNSAYKSALQCMTEAVYYEAANEALQGKRAVAQVILNRLKHPAYPNSVCGVVYQGVNLRVCQFSFTCDGSLLRKPMARQWVASRAVAAGALSGKTEGSVGTATHYHADYVLPYWAHKLAKVEVVGRHIFYRFNGRWGSSSAFSKKWAGREVIPQLDYDRLRKALPGVEESEELLAVETVPGLTVIRDVKDRHAESDVGGRIDPTKEWRLSIPDPVTASSGYRAALEDQGTPVLEQPERVAELNRDMAGTQ